MRYTKREQKLLRVCDGNTLLYKQEPDEDIKDYDDLQELRDEEDRYERKEK